MSKESAPSLLLVLSTALAMLMANSIAADSYFHALHLKIGFLSLEHWINDGLMAIFFFSVGLEIKKEIVDGELSTIRKASLPAAAAIGGMIVPALIYYLFNHTGAAVSGWAIPMATDIAFAVGVLSLLGKRVPLSLKIFLLALAIVDDLGAISVIAVFFTKEIRLPGLLLACAAIASVAAVSRFRFKSHLIYLPLGILLWFGILYSGIHATVAGVILGLMLPIDDDLIHHLHPWVGFAIMPIFALANAGISLTGVSASVLVHDPIALGVGLGLLIGKPVGVLLAIVLALSLRWAELPTGLTLRHLAGASCLSGIGFTMAIFITNLSLDGAGAVEAKAAIIVGSLLSAVLGYAILKFTLTPPQAKI